MAYFAPMTSTPSIQPKLRQTKIVATLGPSTNTPEKISALLQAGMNVARLNFSHGTHEEHSRLLNIVREEAKKLGRPVAVFQDLCGPKVRIGLIEGGEISLVQGSKISLKHTNGEKGDLSTLYVEAFDPVEVMKAGEKAYLSDGQIELIAEEVKKDEVICVVSSGGILRSRSGIAVPDSKLNLPCLTAKDLEDLDWAIANDIDYIALSFVRSGKDILELRERIRSKGKEIPIIAKIERAKALDFLSEIIRTADAVMVARGDLGLELPLEKVPAAQKLIIEESILHGTPVITATQMLRSMVKESRPTRAEVSDVFTAVRDGTDAVMLSDETAVGAHPIESVQILDRICTEAEREMPKGLVNPAGITHESTNVADSICYAACNAVAKLGASAILVCTHTGRSAKLMAKYRPRFPLIAVTEDLRARDRMSLVWGVEPLAISLPGEVTTDEEVLNALLAARDQYGIKPGARVVVTAGLRTKKAGSTNILQVREIPRNA
jgi:pyruvate kinase